MTPNVGIVIVSYNASTAVRITLASLRRARNRTPSQVLLIDNASNDTERGKIHTAFERHVRETQSPWEYIQQDKNLGFSGGNNIGIRRFLEDPKISHICLLNSDVIVTDNWLDHLIDAQCHAISAVTNKADSEQCVPVDYSLDLDACLEEKSESVSNDALHKISNFAQRWRTAWAGSLVKADATFFCVLLSREVIETVGLLDEAFFPGGFEDDDYCLRIHKAGYPIHLARDAFIHHWGSASFGKLQYDYFSERAKRNCAYLEQKHGISWKRRPEKPFVSFLLALEYAAMHQINKAEQHYFVRLYIAQLSKALEECESEFDNLLKTLSYSGSSVTNDLQQQINDVLASGRLRSAWQLIIQDSEKIFIGKESLSADQFTPSLSRLRLLSENIRAKVECNYAMHALLAPYFGRQTNGLTARNHARGNRRGTFGKLIWLFRKGIPFLWNLRGIVFFGGYPYSERMNDGYFQRIETVDKLFPEKWRIYIESDELPGRNQWIDRPQSNVLVLRIQGSGRQKMAARILALLAVLRCRNIYFHSVLRMHDNRFGYLMYLPGIRKIIDIHGVVPEEFRLHNDFYSALLYEKYERLAVRKSNMVVVVTQAMQAYLQQKYRSLLKGRVAVYPFFPDVASNLDKRPYRAGKPIIVYAGGLHKWQQVPKMIDAIIRTASTCEHRFYCPDPEAVRAMLPPEIGKQVIVECRAHEELMSLYAECHYGFILRQDIVVNHVACPTKLVEYLATGIIPIVECENMGDFKAMGMQFVRLEQLLDGELPDEKERIDMARQNYVVYQALRDKQKQGANDIRSALAMAHSQDARKTLIGFIRRIFPSDTYLGRMARSFQRLFSASTSGNKPVTSLLTRTKEGTAVTADLSVLAPCDVMIQVDNFESGGLENVVLDLNDTLMEAGFKMTMLVLGKQGTGIQRAVDSGIPVIVGSTESYRSYLDCLKPRLVLTHYSIHGAEICRDRGIPFLQVIHNTYMWLDAKQKLAFQHAARFTTAFIAVSEYAKNYSVSRLGIDETQCIVIPNGINGKAFDSLDAKEARQALRTKHGLGDKDFVFISVGAINHQKNHISAVRAFARIAEGLPRARLVILGPATEVSLLTEIERFVAERALESKIIYAGSAPTAYAYYAMADAFLTTSFFEGGPLNQLEAIRSNLPCVMADMGFASHFRDLRGCEVVPPALDIAKFNGAIWQLVSTQEFEECLVSAMERIYIAGERPNLPREVLESLDKSHTYDCYVDLINDVLQKKNIIGKSFPSSWPSRLASFRLESTCAST